MAGQVARGRTARGANSSRRLHPESWAVKLVAEDIPVIRHLYNKLGLSLSAIGFGFAVNYGTIYKVVSGKSWVHIP